MRSIFSCKKLFIIILTISFTSSCVNHEKKFQIMQIGDQKLNCSEINKQIKIYEKEINKLKYQKQLKTIKNTSLFYNSLVTFFTSLFFVDFDGEEQEAINLREKRIKHLNDISALNC